MKIRKLILGLAAFTAFAVATQAQNRAQQAVTLAMDYFKTNARAYGLSDPERELVVRSVKDQGNQVVIRYSQQYKNLKVFEAEAIARVSDRGVDVTNALRRDLSMDTQPGIFAAQAVTVALRAIGNRGRAQTSTTLEILPQGERTGRDVLVWHVHVELVNDVDEVASWESFVDAKTGALVWSFNSLHTQSSQVAALGKTMYSGDVPIQVTQSGSVFQMINPTQGAAPGNAMFTNNNGFDTIRQLVTNTVATFGNNNINNSDPRTAAADAAYGLEQTWSFYLTKLNRNGIDGTGRSTYSRVHYGKKYENAFWSDACFCMTYGDGNTAFFSLVSIDIAGHEMTHGVTANEANLTYSGESGGLNESTSDIFGTMVEFFANNPQDTPEFWLGERVIRSNYPGGVYNQTDALRFMDHPSLDGHSPNCWTSGIGSIDVHYSSGPNNHMFYLLAHGGTSACNSQVVSGIGNDKAARIWYKALTDIMTPSTNYHDARTAAVSAATTLFGADSAETAAVKAAYSAINVN
jgi:Zn-dependent metalloprotease